MKPKNVTHCTQKIVLMNVDHLEIRVYIVKSAFLHYVQSFYFTALDSLT